MDNKRIIEMKQERANVTTALRGLMSEYENKEMDGIKRDELIKLENSFDALNGKIMAEEAQLLRERVIDGEPKEAKKNSNLNLFAKALTGDINAMADYRNNYTLGTDATGGALTAPMDFRDNLIRGLDNLLFMRQLSTIVGPIGNAQSLGFPFRNVEATDASWTAEITAATEDTTLTFGRREFKPNKLAKLIKASRTLINNSSMAESTLQREMLYKIGTAQEAGYLTGNGTAQPLGIFTASASGIPTGRDVSTGNTATTVTLDNLLENKYNVKQQYHANASWVASRPFAKAIAKIKDGDGMYVWQPSLIAGQPDRLLGAPIYLSEYAPSTFTTGLYVAVYGDFKQGYMIADGESINIQVLKELFAVNNQIGYLVDYFGDGAPVISEAFSRVKLA